MEGFAGKVAVVTGAGSGIGQALAIELARSGAKLAISDVDTEGLAATEERLTAIGAPVKADRLDVTEREAFAAVRRRGQRALRQGQPDLQQRGHRVHRRHRGQPVQGHRAGDGRRLLGRRQRHQGVPAAPDRLRRRARRQHLQRVRAVRGARPGRLQRGQVRGARIHRGAAPGDDRRGPSGQGDDGASRRHQDRDRPQRRAAAEGVDQDGLAKIFDKKLASTSPQKAAQDHPRRRPQEQGARAGRHRRQGARPHRPGHRFGLSCDGDVVPSGHARRREGPLPVQRVAAERSFASLVAPSGCSARNASATEPGRRRGDCRAHLRQRGGVQHARHLVEREHLRSRTARCADTAAPRSRRGSATCDRPAPPRRSGMSGSAVDVHADIDLTGPQRVE